MLGFLIPVPPISWTPPYSPTRHRCCRNLDRMLGLTSLRAKLTLQRRHLERCALPEVSVQATFANRVFAVEPPAPGSVSRALLLARWVPALISQPARTRSISALTKGKRVADLMAGVTAQGPASSTQVEVSASPRRAPMEQKPPPALATGSASAIRELREHVRHLSAAPRGQLATRPAVTTASASHRTPATAGTAV